MTGERDLIDYKALLEDKSSRRLFPRIGNMDELIPVNSVEAIEYHKNCLNVFLSGIYRLKAINGVAIIPAEVLKEQFLKRYEFAVDKESLIKDEYKQFHVQLAKVNGKDYRLSKMLYEAIKLGQEDKIYNIPYSSTSYLPFRQYAKIWDLLNYKVFIDRLYNRDYSTKYQQLNFDLRPGDSDECDHSIPAQADHPFRAKLTRAFRGKLTTPNA
jgi:hypothetical protein